MTFGLIETVEPSDGGNDTITTWSGNDIVLGGNAGDEINVGQGHNVVLGDDGRIDYVREERDGAVPGADLNPGDIDLIESTSTTDNGGADLITSGDGDDIIIGGRFGDTITADDGDNLVIGDSGKITAADANAPQFGGQPMTFGLIETIQPDDGGDDTITTLSGYDIVFGGDENDTIVVSDLLNLNTTTDHNIVFGDNGLIDYVRAERALGVGGADLNPGDIDLIESTATDFAGGMDTITSGDGQDIIIGGRFGDVIMANDGDNLVIGDSGQIVAAAANTVQQFLNQPMTVGLITTIQPDDGGDDTITTGDDNDIILGGFESDTIVAGEDDDWVLGDNGLFRYDQLSDNVADLGRPDVVAYLGEGVPLTLDSSQLLPDPRTLDLVMTTDPTLGDDDIIYGNAGNDVIFGGTGRDRIWGDSDNDNEIQNEIDGDGADLIFGDHAKMYPSIDDALIDGETNPDYDSFFINNNFFSIDTLETNGFNTDGVTDFAPGTDFEDIIFGSGGDDTIIGGQDDDILFGGEDNDILIGGHNILGGHDEIDDMDEALTRAILSGVLADSDPGDINDVNDIMDGGGDKDVLAGDNAIIIRQHELSDSFLPNSENLRYQQLNGTEIYSMNSQTIGGLISVDIGFSSNIEGTPQSEPGSEVGYTVTLLDHSENIAAIAADNPNGPRVFGNDVMAGGSENDEMFGQLGDDIMQGDGSIDLIVNTDDSWQTPDNDTPFDPSPAVDPSFIVPDNQTIPTRFMVGASDDHLLFHIDESASDGDDYMEGNGGNDRMYGNLGQDDMIGGSSTLFGLDDAMAIEFGLNSGDFARPDGADLMYGGAGNPTRLARNDFVGDGVNDTTESSSNDPQIPLDNRYARDADVIVGDNANIYRLVDNSGNYLEFSYDQTSEYDDRGTLRVIPRAVDFLDYEYSYADLADPSSLTFNAIGTGDLIYGESGDDIIHGMTGDDVIFGHSENDDLYGEAGQDWISGGTGVDGILGDDGLIKTSRNDLVAENLHGISALNPEQGNVKNNETVDTNALNTVISTPGNLQQAIINVEGELRKTVDLISFDAGLAGVGVNDIIYGGLNNDWIHAGAGDDAVSGAEALPTYYDGDAFGFRVVNELLQDQQEAPINGGPSLAADPFWFSFAPYNPGDILRYEGNTAADADDPHGKTKQEFALYDEFNPRRKVMLDAKGEAAESEAAAIFDFLLNFNQFEGPLGSPFAGDDDPMQTDGDDRIFGDLGNDWIVGGTGRDHMYGGRGDDLLNMDDNHDSGSGGKTGPHDPSPDALDNTRPDEYQAYADITYGGAGRDVMILNTGADRAIDWVGEYNSFIVPFSPFGAFHISRALQPQIPEFLFDLAESDGVDTTVPDGGRFVEQKNLDVRVDDPDPLRNGEPYGELGMVRQSDYDWFNQTGAPNDPQPGNFQGKREIMRRELFAGGVGQTSSFSADTGTWTLANGVYEAAPAEVNGEAVSIYHLDLTQPSYMEILTTVNVEKDKAGVKSNAYIIFDYQSESDFKFAGIDVGLDKLRIGHKTAEGWVMDTQSNLRMRSGTDYDLTLIMHGSMATLWIGQSDSISFDFGAPINSGYLGAGTDNAVASFDDWQVQKLPPTFTFVLTQDFSGSIPNAFIEKLGAWSAADGQYIGSLDSSDRALTTWNLGVAAWSRVELEAVIETGAAGGLVFDYYNEDEFKFAAIDITADKVIIGHHTSKGWFIEAEADYSLKAGTGYNLGLSILGTSVSVTLDGEAIVGNVFNSLLNDGSIGLLSKDGSSVFDDVVVRGDDPAFTNESGASLMAVGVSESLLAGDALTLDGLSSIFDEAVMRWAESGLIDGDALALLDDTSIQIVDFTDTTLGMAEGNTIQIDSDAAGYGWFIDQTPGEDEEFGLQISEYELSASDSSLAFGRMDLLSVVMHEIGHLLGFENLDPETDNLMSETLESASRRISAYVPSVEDDSPSLISMDMETEIPADETITGESAPADSNWVTGFLTDSGGKGKRNPFEPKNKFEIRLNDEEEETVFI